MAASQTYTGNGLTVTIVDPENISKDECLQLARAGKDAWNSWRREFGPTETDDGCVNRANFEKVDFRSERVDFTSFEFGREATFASAHFGIGATFSKARFGDYTTFEKAQFGGASRFKGAYFGDRTCFEDTQFSNHASFDGSRFGDVTTFRATKFGDWASFEGSRFGENAVFAGAQFGKLANFEGAKFGSEASFNGAQFDAMLAFSGAQFGDWAMFVGAQFGNRATFDGAQFSGQVSFLASTWAGLAYIYGDTLAARQDWADARGLAPTTFHAISFDGAVFGNTADFANRQFLGNTRFARLPRSLEKVRPILQDNEPALSKTGEVIWDASENIAKNTSTRFAVAPRFHGCQLHQDTSFDGAEFPSPSGEEFAARAYRTLKLAFAQQQAIREEQRFFKLEMQEEAAWESGWKRWLYRGYDFFSDFGFSIWRPLARLVLWPSLGFMLGYQWLMMLNYVSLQTGPLINEPALLSQWLQFTFANLAPLPDSELIKDLRSKLFDEDGKTSLISVAALALETLQKLLALIGYFLMGLALRNLFKMK